MAQEVPTSALASSEPISHQGQTRNISSGGMCLLLDRACTPSSILRCEVSLPESSATIPTLGRVQWIKNHDHSKFLAGMEFLL